MSLIFVIVLIFSATFENPSVAWHFNTGADIRCSPVVANIDDKHPGSEIVIGNINGEVFCLSSEGSLIWNESFGSDYFLFCPTIADIDDDETPEVLIYSKTANGQGCVFCLNNDGSERWRFNTYNYRNWSGLTVANIDNLGNPEILVGSSDGNLYCLNSNGNTVWTYSTGGCITVPSVANIDGLETPEVIFGNMDEKLRCLDSKGNLKWETYLGFPTRGGGTAIADVDLDGEPEIIVNTNVYSGISYIWCIKNNGGMKWRKKILNNNSSGLSMAAVDDINNDSYPEIVIFSNCYNDLQDSIFALQDAGDSARIVWSTSAADWIGGSRTIPIICNLDGENSKEVIWMGTEYLRIYDGSYGNVIYENIDFQSPTAVEHPAVADIDGDGHAEIIATYRNTEIAVLECDEWVKCRDQFSSYTYHITNINDDLSVPRIEPNSWETHNSWLAQGFLPVGNIIVRPDQTDSILPDSTIDYTLMVTNNTDSSDVINISASGTKPEWTREIYDSAGLDTLTDTNSDGIPDIDSLAPDNTVNILVKITPPSDALYGDTDTTIVTGSLSSNPSIRDHARLITMVERLVAVNIEPASSDSIQPGETVRYYLWVRNEGNSTDCIDIIARSDWDISILGPSGEDTLTDTDGDDIQDVGDISPDESRGLFVDITPPYDVIIGEIDTTLVFAYSSIDTSVSDSVLLITKIYGDIGVIIEPDTSDSIYPGEMIEYQLYITNVGRYEDVIDIEATHTQQWDFSLLDTLNNQLYDTDGDGRIDVGSLSTEETASITFRITPPSFLQAGLEDSSVIYAISSLDTTITDSVLIFTKIRRIVDIELEPEVSIDSIAPLETTFYPFSVINFGNGDDTVDLFISDASPEWEYIIYDEGLAAGDHNNNTIPDVIIPMYGEKELNLKVIPPMVLVYMEDSIKLIGISSVKTSVKDSIHFITVITQSPSISIEPDIEDYIKTAEVKEYILTVSSGNIEDTVSLSLTPLPYGWGGALYYENDEIEDINGDGLLDLGCLSPLEERDITFKITAPQVIVDISNIDVETVVFAYSMLYPPLSDSAVIITHLRLGLDIYNYESPFKDKTVFVFSLPESGNLTIDIYNRVGERIRELISSRHFDRGIFTETWNGTNDYGEQVSPGVYIYVCEFENDEGGKDRVIKKTILLK
ncbi:PQQ-binding-like beta-propeller repeat protein [candidate division WOR-3 bacterium]|nr:PQQ-binding-like beta-propeller repeat protein [candidate division WOR-3 bacterium]